MCHKFQKVNLYSYQLVSLDSKWALTPTYQINNGKHGADKRANKNITQNFSVLIVNEVWRWTWWFLLQQECIHTHGNVK